MATSTLKNVYNSCAHLIIPIPFSLQQSLKLLVNTQEHLHTCWTFTVSNNYLGSITKGRKKKTPNIISVYSRLKATNILPAWQYNTEWRLLSLIEIAQNCKLSIWNAHFLEKENQSNLQRCGDKLLPFFHLATWSGICSLPTIHLFNALRVSGFAPFIFAAKSLLSTTREFLHFIPEASLSKWRGKGILCMQIRQLCPAEPASMRLRIP